MESIIRARAPLRLGLAGGGTDVSPYCDLYGGAVLNASIDKYAYTIIKKRTDNNILFSAEDLKISQLKSIDSFKDFDKKLMLHKKVYGYMIKNFNHNKLVPLELITYCDAKPGSGLGSSSTLIVSMVKGFTELFNLGLDSYEIAQIAINIERNECNISGGRQDQYSATFGGFNLMEFYENDKSKITPLKIKNWIICELEASLILYFTGVSRESSRIIEDQIDGYRTQNKDVINSMHIIKKETYILKESLLKGDFEGMVSSVNLGWENKKKSSRKISNQKIDIIFKRAFDEGALAGKVSGAGGGGFMWFIVPPDKKVLISEVLKSYGGEVSNCHFTYRGCEAWKII